MPDRSKEPSMRATRGAEKRRLLPYVSSDLYSRLSQYCAAKSQTQSAVVEAALSEYLDEARDDRLIMRRLDRLGLAQDRAQRDHEILSLTFGIFLQVWFAHTPAVPADAKDAARRAAASRYKQFLDHTAEQFTNGRRFIDDWPKELLAEDGALESIANASARPSNTDDSDSNEGS